MQDMYPVIKTVVELVLEFSERFTQAKQTKTMIDFSDLEHYSLRILTDDASTPNMIIPSDVAKDYQQKFQEVLVDEYQDINHVQETIISLVSEDRKSTCLNSSHVAISYA